MCACLHVLFYILFFYNCNFITNHNKILFLKMCSCSFYFRSRNQCFLSSKGYAIDITWANCKVIVNYTMYIVLSAVALCNYRKTYTNPVLTSRWRRCSIFHVCGTLNKETLNTFYKQTTSRSLNFQTRHGYFWRNHAKWPYLNRLNNVLVFQTVHRKHFAV